ncbi:MAG: alpha/beta fold hydrolase [Proteobacteria bacterium]|nr:alpha/beta fold hydrolase [Pseudomonadota bacterium]HQR03030.1 alpha/beta fold hydrolase [Rhodocyclaceae bacterium]
MIRVLTRRIDVGPIEPRGASLSIAVDVFIPEGTANPDSVLLFCLPGGSMNRRYYDLSTANGSDDESFSFARQMAARGFIVATVDHLGIGDSDGPADLYLLTSEAVAAANHHAVRQIRQELREGRLDPGLPPCVALFCIGVGHSMGGLLTVIQQAHHDSHHAVALLGFGTRGLPEVLTAEERALAADRSRWPADLPGLARTRFEAPPPPRAAEGEDKANRDWYYGAGADPRGVQAIKPARDRMLPVPAMHSLMPDNVWPEAGQIRVPVFLAVGDRDITGPAHQIPAAFAGSPDLTLQVLPATGHSHFLFPSRTRLYERFAAWVHTVAAQYPRSGNE